MKTKIPFYHKVTGIKSTCGDPLEILYSSHTMDWDGVLVERGHSPHFHPKDVITPNFYFAIEMEQSFEWQAEKAGNTIELITEPGDIWINPPNTPFTHNIDVPCNFLIINISEERMFNSFEGYLPDNLKFLNNYNIQDKTLEHLMHLLLFEVQAKNPNGKWYVDNVLTLFSNYFIRHFSNYHDLLSASQLSSIIGITEMEEIDQYIDDHIAGQITIEDLANVLNVSKFHFLNEFKKFNGVTPYQHLMNTRIEKAKIMLLDRELKITNIAYALGFSDSSHFSRTFKKATSTSPKDYRESATS